MKISPDEALGQLFEIIRQEASANPAFARRMLDALGATVTFSGPDALPALDPIILAARHQFPEFREALLTFSDKDLKDLLTKYALATSEQIKKAPKAQKKDNYIEMLWDGSRRKLNERRAADRQS